MVYPVDQSRAVGSTVHAKAIHVMAEAERRRLYGSQKKVKMVEEVVVNVDLKITKERRKQFYVIAKYKNPDGSIKRARLYIKSVVPGPAPVPVPVPVNLPDTAPLLTATTTTKIPAKPSTRVPVDISKPLDSAPVPTTTTTTVAPALLPTTTIVPANRPTTVAPSSDLTITATVPVNPPITAIPEPDTTTTTCVYANHPTQNAPVPDRNPPPTHVAPVLDTPPPTTSTRVVVADCHGVKWYDSKNLIE